MTQPITDRSVSYQPENLNKALLDLARYLQDKGVVVQGKLPFGVSIQLYQLLSSYFNDPLAQELWLSKQIEHKQEDNL